MASACEIGCASGSDALDSCCHVHVVWVGVEKAAWPLSEGVSRFMVQVGKRYRCNQCGTEMVCLKSSAEGQYECCDAPMEEVQVTKLPSSD